MKKEITQKDEIKLVGLSARTNNENEMNPAASKIAALMGQYFGHNLSAEIPNRKYPGMTLAVYTDYASNELGDYTYFLGEEVTSFENVPPKFQTITMPAAKYQKFTTEPGQMPDVVISAWQEIWQMTDNDFGGKRTYQADFELYDQRASDPANASLDIFIGIE